MHHDLHWGEMHNLSRAEVGARLRRLVKQRFIRASATTLSKLHEVAHRLGATASLLGRQARLVRERLLDLTWHRAERSPA